MHAVTSGRLTLADLPSTFIVRLNSGEPIMAERRIQVGQVWRKVGSEETFLVTRLYNEALTTIAVLRSTDNEQGPPVRVQVERSESGQSLPGYAMAQGGE
jgi:hypothetical protein